MPVTGPTTHVNPFVDSVDLHSPSPTSSPRPQSPAVKSSRPLGSTGPLERLTSHSARTQGTSRGGTNPFDTPRVGKNPFDTPRVSTNPFDTPRVSTNPFDTPRGGTDSLAKHGNEQAVDETPGAEPHDTASLTEHDASTRPMVEPEPGVHLPSLKIPPRTSIKEEVVSPVSVFDVGSPFGSAETPHTPNSPHTPASGPRADTAAAFAKLRNRHGGASPSRPSTPRIGATERHDEVQPDVEPPEAANEEPGVPPRPTARPQHAPNSAAEFAEETMEQTSEFMSPMVKAQMFAAESQMLISMVQAQVDVAKAAASAVADAARKS